jgi:hypothetical protein
MFEGAGVLKDMSLPNQNHLLLCQCDVGSYTFGSQTFACCCCCWFAEESINVNYPEYAMDIAYDVNNCKINTADFWTRDPIRIPFNHLRTRPCDLRVTLSPQLPVKK